MGSTVTIPRQGPAPTGPGQLPGTGWGLRGQGNPGSPSEGAGYPRVIQLFGSNLLKNFFFY